MVKMHQLQLHKFFWLPGSNYNCMNDSYANYPAFFAHPFFLFFALSSPPFLRAFSSPKSSLSGTSLRSTLSIERKGNLQSLGFGDGSGWPRGPCRTKNTTRSKFTTRSLFSTAGWFTIAARLVRTPVSWELQTFFLTRKGPRRTKFGGRSKNSTA